MQKQYSFVRGSVSNNIKNYIQFCAMFGVTEIKSLTRICNSASFVDHILASVPERIYQKGVIDVGLSDRQHIYCARKISSMKTGDVPKK